MIPYLSTILILHIKTLCSRPVAGVLCESQTTFRDLFATHVVADDERRFVTGQNQNSGYETSHTGMYAYLFQAPHEVVCASIGDAWRSEWPDAWLARIGCLLDIIQDNKPRATSGS